jgi:hypothetical protein
MESLMVGFGRMRRVAWMVALAMVVSCGAGLAQETGADSPFAGMRAKLKAGDRVTVSLEDGSTVKGRFLDVGTGALSISTPAGDRRFQPSAVTQVQRHRRGVLLGAIIGGGIGLTCGAALGSLFANEGHDRDGPLFGLTALGLGTGIAIDAFANIPRTVYERKPARMTFTIEARPRRIAAGVVVLF